MDIQRHKEDSQLVVNLTGRLDATWCPAVQDALTAAIREGEHRIVLDLSGVTFISSAGLRVFISTYKQLAAIKGFLAVRNATPEVRGVLDLSGLGKILAGAGQSAKTVETSKKFQTASASWELFVESNCASVALQPIGRPCDWAGTTGQDVTFDANTFGLGIAALGTEGEDRFGEFLAVAGCAAHLPAGDANRPDFAIAEQDLKPAALMTSGLVASGKMRHLLRFEATADARTVGFAEIAESALAASDASSALVVLAAETSGLVGASRRGVPQNPADPFALPGIRDWLTFTSERSFRDTTTVILGVVSRPGSQWDSWLRPVDRPGKLLGHFHAAPFPYRPLQKERIALGETITTLFEEQGMQSVLHLINDTREPGGTGESQFLRGACWVSPISAT